MIGIWAAIANDQNLARVKRDDILLEFMKAIYRSDLHTKHNDDIEQMHYVFDSVLMRNFNRNKNTMAEVTWLSAHHEACRVTMDESDLDPVLAANGEWSLVKPQLLRLSRDTAAGEVVFAFPSTEVKMQEFKEDVDAELLKVKQAEFSDASVNTYRTQMSSKIVLMGDAKLTKRDVTVIIKEIEYKDTLDYPQEVEWRLGALIRENSLGMLDGIELAPWEEWMFGHVCEKGRKCVVPRKFLEPHIKVRQAALAMIHMDRITCFNDIQKVCAKAAKALTDVFRGYKLELDFIRTDAEKYLAQSLRQAALSIMPNKHHNPQLEKAYSELTDLKASKHYGLSSLAVQGEVDDIVDAVGGLMQNISPDPAVFHNGGEFYIDLLRAMGDFLQHTEADGTIIYGADAMKVIFKKISTEASRSGDSPELDALANLQRFQWMLSGDNQTQLATWVKDAVKAKADSKKRKTDEKNGNKKKSAKGKEGTGAASVMRFFS